MGLDDEAVLYIDVARVVVDVAGESILEIFVFEKCVLCGELDIFEYKFKLCEKPLKPFYS